MNIELLGKYIWIGCWTVIGLALASIILVGAKPGRRLWSFLMPAVTVLVYVPYEAYFHIREVSLGVPIRVDLLLIIPLFEAMFLTGLVSGIVMRWKYRRPVGIAIVLAMGGMAVLWPVYVAVFLMGLGR